MIEVLPVGAKVRIADSTIPAIVHGIVIRVSGISYEVAWWDGRSRHSEWLPESEVNSDDPTSKIQIGFRQNR